MGVRIGVLHPGNMGAALAACVDSQVFWASEGRSQETATRAREVELVDLGSQDSLVSAVDVVISVCPPAAAVGVAEQVSGTGFDGLYVDVNAVSPATTRQIGQLFNRFVDGGVVGPPPSSSRASQPAPADSMPSRGNDSDGTRLYLSGREASEVAALFAGSAVDTHVVGSDPGRASALKMSYAAWTKGTSALLLSVAALATSEEVIDELLDEWDISIPELRERLHRVSGGIGEKAWRFAGEMEEIARTYGDAELPNGFHLAAADIYSRLAGLKDHPPGQAPGDVLDMLLHKSGEQRVTS
ncbi:MAG TPA: DUF1932 domain-containing protein [Acidimicrobiia bacterium]